MLYEVDNKLLDCVKKDMLDPKKGKMETGFKTIDDITGGYKRGQLVVLGSRQMMGKTSFALSMLNKVCVRDKYACAYFTSQNSKESLLKRLICINGEMKLRPREIKGERIDDCLKDIGCSPLWIDDTPVQYIEDIANKCNELREEQALDYVFVDFLQDVKCRQYDGAYTSDDQEEIIRRLKKIAEDMQCVVFVLSQLKYSYEKKKRLYPKAADFKTLVALDKYADVIFLLYRSGAYDIDANPDLAEIYAVRSNDEYSGWNLIRYVPGIAAFKDYIIAE